MRKSRAEATSFEYKTVFVDLSQYSQIYLVPLADLHEGARDADHEVSGGYIRWIAEHKNAFTFLNGDVLNCAWKDSSPELYEDLITPDTAYQNLLTRLLPIKSKILMITRGGHEESIFRKVGHDYMADLAHDLGDIPYRPDGGMLALRLAQGGTSDSHTAVFSVYATHGWGAARTIGAKVRKVEDLVMAVDADCYVLSHDHTQNVRRLNTLIPTSNYRYLKVSRKLLINTGGFVKYAGYIQRKGYVPTDLGTPRIRMELKYDSKSNQLEKDLHASI